MLASLHTIITALILCASPLAAGAAEQKKTSETDSKSAEAAELVERADAVLEAVGKTPGREFSNVFRSGYRNHWLEHFRKGKALSDSEHARRAKDLRGFIDKAEEGMNWPLPPDIDVPRASSPLEMDGKLDEKDWQRAATFTGVCPFNEKKRLEEPATTWKMLWDRKYMYFGFECADTDIISPVKERDEDVYADDCVEMFIMPNKRFRVYWELVIGPSGSLFDAVHYKHMDQCGSESDVGQDMEGLDFGITIRGSLNKPEPDKGYTVEVAVPFSELPGFSRARPEAGVTLYLMLARLDRQGEKFQPYAFSPLLFWGHNIWNHGKVRLTD
ncbi:MAG: carbohydrate-binding family 9-like protein [Kiritimatiellia bacterium]